MGKIKQILKKLHKFNGDILKVFSPKLFTKYNYLVTFRKRLNLKKPKDFNEKIQWLKFNYRNELMVTCTDKYLVRDYVNNQISENILNELLYVYNAVEEIDWDILPNRFALKTTHGCGGNIICDDKSKLNLKDAIVKLNEWMKTDYSKISGEWQYGKITPRIICEKFLEDGSGKLPRDYKFYCFDGEPKVVLVISERESNIKLDFFDLKWNRLHLSKPIHESKEIIKKPENLDVLLDYARKLSKPFPFVRADFYNVDGKPIFGELTFTPAAGMATYYTDYGANYLGELLKLEKTIKS